MKPKPKPKEKEVKPFDRVLVACPTYLGKSYALEPYIKAYNQFTFPHRGLFMVDNTGTGLKYYKHLKSLKVPCEHIPPVKNWQETFAMCWKRILNYAKENKYDWIASIEQDNICPPLTLDVLLNMAGYTKALLVAHSYPWHSVQSVKGTLVGLGCDLISVGLLDAVFAQKKWITDAFESEIFTYAEVNKIISVKIDHLLQIQHLDSEGVEFYQFERENLPEFTKGNRVELRPAV
jgi:hypothetical protein